jgi:hypothetical protein
MPPGPQVLIPVSPPLWLPQQNHWYHRCFIDGGAIAGVGGTGGRVRLRPGPHTDTEEEGTGEGLHREYHGVGTPSRLCTTSWYSYAALQCDFLLEI